MNTIERYLSGNGISFKYAKGASSMVGREFHPYHEIILFYGESAYLFSETVSTAIRPGTVIVIPKETYHQMNIIGSADSYERCVLHFSDIPELSPLISKITKDLTIAEAESGLFFLFDKLKKAAENPETDAVSHALLNSVLTLVLSELESEADTRTIPPSINPLIARCTTFIAEHLDENLAISRIARKLNTSESLLSHVFRDEMNIPIHQYILKKRLVTAFEKISSGYPATLAASECGFHEYSNFYRQYKKAFGFPPSSKDYRV